MDIPPSHQGQWPAWDKGARIIHSLIFYCVSTKYSHTSTQCFSLYIPLMLYVYIYILFVFHIDFGFPNFKITLQHTPGQPALFGVHVQLDSERKISPSTPEVPATRNHLLFPERMLFMEVMLGANPIKRLGVWLMLNQQRETKETSSSEVGRHLN